MQVIVGYPWVLKNYSFFNNFHIACIIMCYNHYIRSRAINPELHGYNSLQHSNLQKLHAKLANQNARLWKLFKYNMLQHNNQQMKSCHAGIE